MSLGPGEPASETGDDSLSAITFDSDFETKAKRKSYHKPPPTSPKSPYYSKPKKVASWRSLRTAGSMPLGGRMSLTPQKLWLGTPKPGHVPGTPVYREKEDMYDEIIELKKSLHMQRSDVDLMRTKLRRLEEENSRKDRQIEQLLDPTRGPDFVRTLAEKRPDTGWVVNGLKQRILKLEQQCKEKDSTINKLQADMKTTSLEEMRIAMETYYEEIHRLQTLLASSETTGKKPPVEKKMGLKRQKKMSSALLTLSRSVQELTEENQSLKEDLDRVLSNSPTVSKIKGYVEWSKPRLLRRIAELEKKINSMESAKPHTSELAKSSPLTQSASSSTVPPVLPDRPEECERLRGALRSLRDEQATLNAQLLDRGLEVKQLLQTKADLEQELQSVKESEKEGREREAALREEIQTLTKKCQELEERKKEEKDDPVAVTHEAPEELLAPYPVSGHAQQDAGPDAGELCPGPPSRCTGGQEDGRREEAARILQTRWKAHRHKKREAALDEAATVLQAAFRGHLARAKLLSGQACGSDSPSRPCFPDKSSPAPRVQSPVSQATCTEQEAVIAIQSVFRAHLARTRQSATSGRTATAASPKQKCVSAAYKGASSSPLLAASPAQEDSGGSGGEAVGESATQEEPLGPSELAAPAAQQPCSESSLSGPPATPPRVDEVNSDDSDDVISPSLPGKKISPI